VSFGGQASNVLLANSSYSPPIISGFAGVAATALVALSAHAGALAWHRPHADASQNRLAVHAQAVAAALAALNLALAAGSEAEMAA
jgi:hypothetical protein